jgi:hypothetical protein
MENQTTLQKLEQVFVPSLFAGASSIAIFYLLYDKNISVEVPFASMAVPAYAAIGTTVALGNMAGEVVSEFIIPKLNKNPMFLNMEDKIVPPVTTGLASYLAMRTLVSSETNFGQAFVLGAASSVTGKYVNSMI